jgi:hypothetical protein
MPPETESLLFFETTGLSMWPFLKGKEKLLVKKIAFSDLKLGDLVLYRKNSQLVCHRLIKSNKDKALIYVRGDASLGFSDPVSKEMFLGKAVAIMKNNRVIYLEGRMQRCFTRIILLGAPFLNLMCKVNAFLFFKR